MAQKTQDAYGTTSLIGPALRGFASLPSSVGGLGNNVSSSTSAKSGAKSTTPHYEKNIAPTTSSYNNNYSSGYGSSYGSGGGGGGGGYVEAAVAPAFDPTAALMAALEAQRAARDQAVQAANAALEKQRGVAQGRYDQSLAQAIADYQDLRNRASVQNFKAGKMQREALADRGAFNSGLGLQERLGLSSNLTNNMNRINTAEQDAKMTLKNNLDNIFAQIDMQKANNLASTVNNYADQVSSLITALFSNYAPSAAYNNMLTNLTGTNTGVASNAVQNGAVGLGNSLYDTLLRYGNY